MTTTPRSPKSYNKTLDLSPEARAALKLPLEAGYAYGGHCVRNADGLRVITKIGTVATPDDIDAEIAAFFANLVNEALTPAEQPVPMCADPECLNAADPTTSGGARCLQHEAERWTAEQILQREG